MCVCVCVCEGGGLNQNYIFSKWCLICFWIHTDGYHRLTMTNWPTCLILIRQTNKHLSFCVLSCLLWQLNLHVSAAQTSNPFSLPIKARQIREAYLRRILTTSFWNRYPLPVFVRPGATCSPWTAPTGARPFRVYLSKYNGLLAHCPELVE